MVPNLSQAGESEKQKSYEVTVRMPAPVTPEMLASLSAMREVLLQQTTPERVAHRRALLVRALMHRQRRIKGL